MWIFQIQTMMTKVSVCQVSKCLALNMELNDVDVCVSCVASIKYTCVLQCAACGNKELTDVSLVCCLFVLFVD